MAIHLSPSIILRTWDSKESDLVVSFFTEDQGRLKGLAKGARRSRRRFANCLDVFCLTLLEYEYKGWGDLHFLHSGRLLEGFEGLRAEFAFLSLASYMVEVAEVLFPLHVPSGDMFQLLRASLLSMSQGKAPPVLRLAFEARAMSLGGYGIDLRNCCVCARPYAGLGRAVFLPDSGGIACLRCRKETSRTPGAGPEAIKALGAMQAGEWEMEPHPTPDGKDIQELGKILRLHIAYRLGARLKSVRYVD